MTTKPKKTVKDRIKALLGVTTDEELNEALKGEELPEADAAGADPGESGSRIEIHNHMPGSSDTDPDVDPNAEVHDDEPVSRADFDAHVKSNNDRFDRLEGMMAEVLEASTGDAEETPEEKAAREAAAGGDGAETPEQKAAKAAAEQDAQLEGELAEEAPQGTGDKAKKAKDSAYLGDSFQETVAFSEILAPGITLPTFDQKAPPKATFLAVCGLRRMALDKAYAVADTKALIDQALSGKTLDTKTMTCAAVRTVFKTAAIAAKAANKNVVRDVLPGAGGGIGIEKGRKIKSPADLNKLNAERYGHNNRKSA